MGNCTSAEERHSHQRQHDRHRRRSSHGPSHYARNHRQNHHGSNGEPSGFELSPIPAYNNPSQHTSHRESRPYGHSEHTGTNLVIPQAIALLPPLPGPDQPTALLQFPVTLNHETLQQWGYVLYPVAVMTSDGRSKQYQKVMYPGDVENRAHNVAQVRISRNDQLVVSLINTENVPGSSRRRVRASNILVAFWTGSGREVTSIQGFRFENVIEESTREDAGPRAYELLGLPLYDQQLRVGREHSEVFQYIAEHSRLARMVWSMLQCQEMRAANVQIVEFHFRTLAVRSMFIPAEYTPSHFEVKLGIA